MSEKNIELIECPIVAELQLLRRPRPTQFLRSNEAGQAWSASVHR